VRKSWLRRLAVRCFEWRRFGLGIAVSLSIGRGVREITRSTRQKLDFLVLQLELVRQPRKRIPPRVGRSLLAIALRLIQVLTTARA